MWNLWEGRPLSLLLSLLGLSLIWMLTGRVTKGAFWYFGRPFDASNVHMRLILYLATYLFWFPDVMLLHLC